MSEFRVIYCSPTSFPGSDGSQVNGYDITVCDEINGGTANVFSSVAYPVGTILVPIATIFNHRLKYKLIELQ